MSGKEPAAQADKDRVQIFDTTLRDGEQSPGISLNTQEKVEIAQQLARLRVDVIEAGFPITSPGDFEAVEAIARSVEGPVICGLARTAQGGHRRRLECDQGFRARAHPHVHLDVRHPHRASAPDRSRGRQGAGQGGGGARQVATATTSSSRRWTRPAPTSTSPPRSARSRSPRAPNVINIPDTVGYTTPEEYTRYLRRLYELIPELGDVVVSVHCHDDLGLAVANSYAGVLAGARQVECAVNGIGERAGNCSLEEIVMLLRTRNDEHGLDTALDARELARTSRMVSRLTGYAVQPNKAVVGRNAFAHESGIHQDGVLKERTTYEIMDPVAVGLESNSIVLGKHSGRHALKDALEQLGFKVEGGALNQAFKRFKEIADKKKQVTALDLEAIVSDEMRERTDSYALDWFEVEAGSRREPKARVAVRLPSGEESVGEASGDGPVDAIFGAIRDAVETDCELRQFTVSAVTEGEDALGEVTVMLRAHGRLASGQGVATDILEASARAYVRALSNALDGAAVREAEGVTADAAAERTPGP